MIYIENTPTATDALPTILYENYFLTGTLDNPTGGTTDHIQIMATTESTWDTWIPASIPANTLVDMGTSQPADCAAIVAHTCGTNGVTIQVQTSPDNVTWTTRATAVPTDDSTILMLFNSVSARYWRIRFTVGTAPAVGVIMLGRRFTFPAGVKAPYTPVWLSQKSELLTSTSMGGQFMGNRILKKSADTVINLVAVDRDFGEGDLLPFRQHYNDGKAFVFASSPSIFDKDVGYCWRKEGSIISPTFDENGTWMSVGMDVYAYGE